MKHFMKKRPLKMIAVAAFMVALGYGVATNSKISELSSSIISHRLIDCLGMPCGII